MKLETKRKLQKLRYFYVKTDARWGQGWARVNKIFLLIQISVIGSLGIEQWNEYVPNFLEWIGVENTQMLNLSMSALPIILIISFPLVWYLGYLDHEKLHLTQIENEYSQRYLSPLLKRLDDATKEILKRVKKLTGGEPDEKQ